MMIHNLPTQTPPLSRMSSPADEGWLQSLLQCPSPIVAKSIPSSVSLRLIRLDEISEANPGAYRSALANVYATLGSNDGTQFLYLLDGRPEGVALYFGITGSHASADVHEAVKNLWGALEGQLPGIHLNEGSRESVMAHLEQSVHRGLVLGVPTAQDEGQGSEDDNFQGIERLVRTLTSSRGGKDPNVTRWQLVVVCQPLKREEVHQQLNEAYALASDIAARVRTSIQTSGNTSEQKGGSYSTSVAEGENTSRAESRGKSEGASDTRSHGTSQSNGGSSSSRGSNEGSSQAKNRGTNEGVTQTTGTSTTRTGSDSINLSRTHGGSIGVTQEWTDKRSQHLLDHLEKTLIPRLQKGITKGLFRTAIHLCAGNASTYRSLKQTLCATYQGGETTVSPLEVIDQPIGNAGSALHLPTLEGTLDARVAVFHSLGVGTKPNHVGSLLTADELALVAGLPRHELPGLRRRKTVEFIVALPHPEQSGDAIDLGEVINCGRRQSSNRVRLDKADLNKHCFVTGVTGAGKTTTCLNLLVESKLPFLVIEPAKTEYRALHGRLSGDIDFYRPNGDSHRSFRLNPFALTHRGQKIKSHASFLRHALAAIFPMEASMPYLVEQAILRAYEEKGWDLADDTCLLADDPFDPAARVWPTMSDMIRQLDVLIPEQGMGKEFEEKYRGSLVSRLTSLTHGILGDVLDVPQSLDFTALLDRHVVIELEEVKDGEGKALMMALVLGAVSEAIRHRHGQNREFRHLTLVEEAHRLLSRPEPGDKARAMAVDAFADLLAEVRKYGEGLIIADQIPAKLIPDVIKNTHTKIVHRLFAEDDRRAMGEAMMMDDGQRDFLPNLRTGEAVVFCGGWHGPAHVAIRCDHAGTDQSPLDEANIEMRAVQQLWRERGRYYPGLARLDWLDEQSDAPQVFASFVRDTRKAFRYLLGLLPEKRSPKAQDSQRFVALQSWYKTWSKQAEQVPVSEAAWQQHTGQPRPAQPLTAPLLVWLHDASPRAHTQVKQPSTWPWEDPDWSLWQEAMDTLLGGLATARDVTDFRQRWRASRPLQNVLVELGNYQSF
ncbi:MAG: hypothetical protein RLZZ494_2247 [Pseudomonadota bacterium]